MSWEQATMMTKNLDWRELRGRQLVSEEQWDKIGSMLKLSRRELQICQHLFSGMTRDETANVLGIKARTVRHHMENIHTKMNVKNRVSVVLRIIQARDYLKRKDLLGRNVFVTS